MKSNAVLVTAEEFVAAEKRRLEDFRMEMERAARMFRRFPKFTPDAWRLMFHAESFLEIFEDEDEDVWEA